MAYTVKSSERLRPSAADTETKALLYLMNFRDDSDEIFFFVVDFFNDLSLALSIVRICSSRTVDSVLRPLVIIATWVGRAAFVFLPVIAATMVVGLCLLPVLFCKIKTGRTPPCSLPKPTPKSAE